MEGFVVHGNIGMTRGSFACIEDGKDVMVYVWEGALWLTQAGDPIDRYVKAGEWFLLDRQGMTVAHALARSTVMLTAPRPSRYARRVTLRVAGTGKTRVLYDAASEGRSLLGRMRHGLRLRWVRTFRPRAASAAH